MKQEAVRLRLKAIRATALARIEFLGREVVEDRPVPLALVQILEPRVANVANMECLVLFVEQKSAWCDETVARHLKNERRTVAARVVAATFVLQTVALDDDSEFGIGHCFDAVKCLIQ